MYILIVLLACMDVGMWAVVPHTATMLPPCYAHRDGIPQDACSWDTSLSYDVQDHRDAGVLPTMLSWYLHC